MCLKSDLQRIANLYDKFRMEKEILINEQINREKLLEQSIYEVQHDFKISDILFTKPKAKASNAQGAEIISKEENNSSTLPKKLNINSKKQKMVEERGLEREEIEELENEHIALMQQADSNIEEIEQAQIKVHQIKNIICTFALKTIEQDELAKLSIYIYIYYYK